MNKLLIAMMGLGLLVAATGCGGSNAASSDASDASDAEPAKKLEKKDNNRMEVADEDE